MATPYFQDDQVTLYHGDCIDVMRTMPDNSIDSIVTDPPYGLGFMGKAWDDLPPGLPWAQECLRVLKPGGHLLAFGGSRTWHRLACAVEDAGFEIRDSIAWLYGSGFPKSLDVSKAIDKAGRRDYVLAALRLGLSVPGRNLHDWTKAEHSPGDAWWEKFKAVLPTDDWARLERAVLSERRGADRRSDGTVVGLGHSGNADITAPATPDAQTWQGWGTALKPAFEPIVMGRKPFPGTVAGNVLAHGTGALNIDGCRIGDGSDSQGSRPNHEASSSSRYTNSGSVNIAATPGPRGGSPAGRWPANVLLDESQAEALDQQSGKLASGGREHKLGDAGFESWRTMEGRTGAATRSAYKRGADVGGASRFFYCAKAPKAERPNVDGVQHPTVKPLAVMRWLLRLVTPPGGTTLDTFAGSGATVEAALLEGFRPIAIEREADYLPLTLQRIERHQAQPATLDFGGAA